MGTGEETTFWQVVFSPAVLLTVLICLILAAGVIWLLLYWQRRTQRRTRPRSEQRVHEQVRLDDRTPEFCAFGIGVARDDGDAAFHGALEHGVGFRVARRDEVGRDLCAGFSQAARGDQTVPPIVAGADQRQDPASLDASLPQDRAGDSLTGQLHHSLEGMAGGNGSGLPLAHGSHREDGHFRVHGTPGLHQSRAEVPALAGGVFA